MKYIIQVLFTILIIGVVGSILLNEFTVLQPVYEEIKEFIAKAWSYAEVKYGTLAAGIIVIALVFLLGDKKR